MHLDIYSLEKEGYEKQGTIHLRDGRLVGTEDIPSPVGHPWMEEMVGEAIWDPTKKRMIDPNESPEEWMEAFQRKYARASYYKVVPGGGGESGTKAMGPPPRGGRRPNPNNLPPDQPDPTQSPSQEEEEVPPNQPQRQPAQVQPEHTLPAQAADQRYQTQNEQSGPVSQEPVQSGNEQEKQPETQPEQPTETPEVKEQKKSTVKGFLSAMEKVVDLAHGATKIVGQIGSKVWGSLPEGAKNVIRFTGRMALAVDHALRVPQKYTRSLALRVAEARGFGQPYVDMVATYLAIGDEIFGGLASPPAYEGALAVLPEEPALLLAKAAFFTPVASLAYIAGSTVENPIATIVGAYNLVTKGLVKREEQQGYTPQEQWPNPLEGKSLKNEKHKLIEEMFKYFEAARDEEWASAVLAASMDATHDIRQALSKAHEALQKQPENPGQPETGESLLTIYQPVGQAPKGEQQKALSKPEKEENPTVPKQQRPSIRQEQVALEKPTPQAHVEEPPGPAPVTGNVTGDHPQMGETLPPKTTPTPPKVKPSPLKEEVEVPMFGMEAQELGNWIVREARRMRSYAINTTLDRDAELLVRHIEDGNVEDAVWWMKYIADKTENFSQMGAVPTEKRSELVAFANKLRQMVIDEWAKRNVQEVDWRPNESIPEDYYSMELPDSLKRDKDLRMKYKDQGDAPVTMEPPPPKPVKRPRIKPPSVKPRPSPEPEEDTVEIHVPSQSLEPGDVVDFGRDAGYQRAANVRKVGRGVILTSEEGHEMRVPRGTYTATAVRKQPLTGSEAELAEKIENELNEQLNTPFARAIAGYAQAGRVDMVLKWLAYYFSLTGRKRRISGEPERQGDRFLYVPEEAARRLHDLYSQLYHIWEGGGGKRLPYYSVKRLELQYKGVPDIPVPGLSKNPVQYKPGEDNPDPPKQPEPRKMPKPPKVKPREPEQVEEVPPPEKEAPQPKLSSQDQPYRYPPGVSSLPSATLKKWAGSLLKDLIGTGSGVRSRTVERNIGDIRKAIIQHLHDADRESSRIRLVQLFRKLFHDYAEADFRAGEPDLVLERIARKAADMGLALMGVTPKQADNVSNFIHDDAIPQLRDYLEDTFGVAVSVEDLQYSLDRDTGLVNSELDPQIEQGVHPGVGFWGLEGNVGRSLLLQNLIRWRMNQGERGVKALPDADVPGLSKKPAQYEPGEGEIYKRSKKPAKPQEAPKKPRELPKPPEVKPRKVEQAPPTPPEDIGADEVEDVPEVQVLEPGEPSTGEEEERTARDEVFDATRHLWDHFHFVGTGESGEMAFQWHRRLERIHQQLLHHPDRMDVSYNQLGDMAWTISNYLKNYHNYSAFVESDKNLKIAMRMMGDDLLRSFSPAVADCVKNVVSKMPALGESYPRIYAGVSGNLHLVWSTEDESMPEELQVVGDMFGDYGVEVRVTQTPGQVLVLIKEEEQGKKTPSDTPGKSLDYYHKKAIRHWAINNPAPQAPEHTIDQPGEHHRPLPTPPKVPERKPPKQEAPKQEKPQPAPAPKAPKEEPITVEPASKPKLPVSATTVNLSDDPDNPTWVRLDNEGYIIDGPENMRGRHIIRYFNSREARDFLQNWEQSRQVGVNEPPSRYEEPAPGEQVEAPPAREVQPKANTPTYAPVSKADVRLMISANKQTGAILHSIFPNLFDAKTLEPVDGNWDSLREPVAALSGMPENVDIEMREPTRYTRRFSDDQWVPAGSLGFQLIYKGDDLTELNGNCSDFIGVTPDGEPFIYIELIGLQPSKQGSGMMSKILASKVTGAMQQGMKYIACHAAGTAASKYNGYYTWPALGFDQKFDQFDTRVKKALKARFPEAQSVLDLLSIRNIPIIQKPNKKGPFGIVEKEAELVRDLCAQVDNKLGRPVKDRTTISGRDWWLACGVDMHYAAFDLTPGSKSLKVFEQSVMSKLNKKGKEA